VGEQRWGMENETILLPRTLGDKEISTFVIEDNADGSYRDFTSTFLQRGWISEKKNSKFQQRRCKRH
jgi:hypothetical protein